MTSQDQFHTLKSKMANPKSKSQINQFLAHRIQLWRKPDPHKYQPTFEPPHLSLTAGIKMKYLAGYLALGY